MPSVRQLGEQVARRYHAPLLRINQHESDGDLPGLICYPSGALEALQGLL